jgi:hypothetical protein
MLVLLLVVVFNTSKLTHVFGSKVLVLVLVCYKLTLTPPSKHPMLVIISKKREEGIRSRAQETGRGSVLRRSMKFPMLAGKPCEGCSKFPTYIYHSAHEISIVAQSRQGHACSFIKHSYACRSYSAPRETDPQRAHSPLRHRHSPLSPSPLSPRRSPALLQPHRFLRDEGDEDAITGVQTYIRPT